MISIRKILVPVDFSEHSREALRYACDLAGRYGAALTLLHVLELPPRTAGPDGYLLFEAEAGDALREPLEQQLHLLQQELTAGGTTSDARLIPGRPASEIVRAAAEGGYDLVVMGTHGRTGLGRALLGSVAERVVRRARCPVLTVHRAAHEARHP
jgi:universal stress protein A